MMRSTKIWSVHPLPLLNPACSSRNVLSKACLIRCRRTLQNNFPGTDRRLIPLYLPNTDRSPFFGNFTMVPFCHASGTFSSYHTLLKSYLRAPALATGSAVNMSADTLSFPCVLFPFVCLIAFSISPCVILPRFISMLKPMSSISASTSWSGLFRFPYNAQPTFSVGPPLSSAHSRFCPFNTTVVLLINPLVSCLMILYTVLVSLFSAAVCASLARLSV